MEQVEQQHGKTFCGHKPSAAWKQIGVTEQIDGVAYDVFRLDDDGTSGWVNIKFAARTSAAHKANYWLAWNGERFAQSRDYTVAREHRPALLDQAKAFALAGADQA